MSKTLLACLALVALLATGCVSEPTMRLWGARITHATPAGVGLTMTLKVKNDISFDVMVRDVHADVVVADRYRMPPVIASPNVWLPAKKETVVPVPVVMPWTLIPAMVQTTVGSTSVPYRARGYANVTATSALRININDYKFDQDGAFARIELLHAAQRGAIPGLM